MVESEQSKNRTERFSRDTQIDAESHFKVLL